MHTDYDDNTLPVTARIISLGAGVQSTAMLLMAVRGDLKFKPDAAIFSDTGWEPKAVYRHLEWLEGECKEKIPIYRVSIGNIKEDALDVSGRKRFAAMPLHILGADGKKGMIRRQCTYEYKIRPIERKTRELLGLKKGERFPKETRVHKWIGISSDEAMRMKDSGLWWCDHIYPLIDVGMSRSDCIEWLKSNNYPVPPKSSCIGCPFHNDAHWREIRDNSPEEWQEAIEFDKLMRHGHKPADGEDPLRGTAYLHTQRVPLDQVILIDRSGKIEDVDHFGNECEGMCGV